MITQRLLCVGLATFLLMGGTAGGALAQADNVAYAENTKDGTSVFRLAFNIRRVMHETVDVDNAAVAFSSCDGCRSVAVAISVVLIMSDPEVVTTDNLALAYNYQCTLCETMALAYQLVVTTAGPVQLTGDTNKLMAEILHQIRELAGSERPLEEIDAEIGALVDQLFAIVGDAISEEPSDPSPSPIPSPSHDDLGSPSPEPSEPSPSQTSETPSTPPPSSGSSTPAPTPTS